MIMSIREKYILLLSKDAQFLADMAQKKFSTKYGEIDLTKIKNYGQKIKVGKLKFIVVKPMIIDLLKKCKRGPQIVMPKDAATIAAVTGLSSGWNCLDSGSGSGFLSIFIANLVKPGKVVTYEKNKDYARNVRNNIKTCGLKNLELKNEDVKKFTEHNLDLVTLDMKDADKLIPKIHKALKHGGWLCVYSPHIEQQKKCVTKIRKFGFTDIKTLENIQRSWQVSDYTHPKPSGIMHTGFLTFARKV